MTTKTLGQVLYEADVVAESRFMLPWGSLQAPDQHEYERMAQAVAAVVREQCAQACEAAWYVDGSVTAQEFAAIISDMNP